MKPIEFTNYCPECTYLGAKGWRCSNIGGKNNIADEPCTLEDWEGCKYHPEPQNYGYLCDVCGERISGETKTQHLQRCHKEYRFEVFERESMLTRYRAFKCAVCDKILQSPCRVVEHYKEFHKDSLKQSI